MRLGEAWRRRWRLPEKKAWQLERVVHVAGDILAGLKVLHDRDIIHDGFNAIVKGEMTVTILKDIRNLSPLAANTMDALLQNQAVEGLNNYIMADLTLKKDAVGEVPSVCSCRLYRSQRIMSTMMFTVISLRAICHPDRKNDLLMNVCDKVHHKKQK